MYASELSGKYESYWALYIVDAISNGKSKKKHILLFAVILFVQFLLNIIYL